MSIFLTIHNTSKCLKISFSAIHYHYIV